MNLALWCVLSWSDSDSHWCKLAEVKTSVSDLTTIYIRNILVTLYVRNAHKCAAAEIEDNEDGHAVLPSTHFPPVSQVEDYAGSITDVAALAEIIKLQDWN